MQDSLNNKGWMVAVEFTKTDFWRDDFIRNIRHEAREDDFYFVKHNFKYYLFPNTNHVLLGFEGDGEFVNKRYQTRAEFMNEVYRLGFYPYEVDSVKKCLKKGLTEKLKECINSEKFLNDWYRYEILGLRDQVNNHDFSYIKKIWK